MIRAPIHKGGVNQEPSQVTERPGPPPASRAQGVARPASEYHEDMGPVLWWTFPINEPPYVGTPNDLGYSVLVEVQGAVARNGGRPIMTAYVGGWPGYHTHFTPIPIPAEPA